MEKKTGKFLARCWSKERYYSFRNELSKICEFIRRASLNFLLFLIQIVIVAGK